MRVLVVAHGHPSIHKGGGEVAAYSLFKMLRDEGHQAIFLGWSGHTESPTGESLEKFGEDDFMLYTRSEFFHFSSRSPNLKQALEKLFSAYDFDVVHFHHYIHVGIEAAAIVKQIKTTARVILTLHEYLAICANNGQLLNKQGQVCSGYNPDLCSKCFPEYTPNEFFMRELAIKAAFSFIDHFIAPSEFLRQQYVEWGIPANKIDAIENPLPLNVEEDFYELPPPKSGKPWKIGYFGQINYYKGLDIILDGIQLAVEQGAEVEIGIHGKMSQVNGYPDYLNKVENKIKALGERAVFHGPYMQSDVIKIMQQYHFVAMGSRWYENSPVVIQEAIAGGCPLLLPRHGGMIEKGDLVSIFYKPNEPVAIANMIYAFNEVEYKQLKSFIVSRMRNMPFNIAHSYHKTKDIYIK